MVETRSSFSGSSSVDHQLAAASDDADDFELYQRVERIEFVSRKQR